ncbi:amino acid adenylation domain-containing protein [Micromonospora sp. NPDC023956]|uniref:non-ribosomal peptide synthetase n=1 Tax=Micromonospora sp. NPDC023956 TaxID=3155722 RepID=UPI0033ED61ED
MGQEGLFDLAPSQEIVWVHERLSPGSRAYNFTAFVVVRGDLDPEAVHEALGHVLDHHDGLRLELADTPDARPAQRVRARCRPRFRTLDISGEPDVDAAFDEVVRVEATTGFDTYEAPLVRWCLVRTGAREHRLIHVEHHLIHDGRSFLILAGDLFRAYRSLVAGAPVELPATVSYTDHLRRVAAVSPGDRAESLAFWHRELADATFEATLPGLARPGAVRRNHGAQHRQRFAPEVADRIRARSAESGHTVYTTMLGLFAELVRRHCGQDDLVVGTAVGNRYDAVDTSVGMFVNTIPLRLRLSGETPVDDMLSDVTETLIRAIPHQDVPIQQLTREVGRHTSGVENPLFNIAFSGVDDTVPDVRVPGLDVVLSEGHNFGTTRFDLDLVFIPDARRVVGPRVGPAALDLHWDYDADLFSAETVRLLADRLAALVEAYLDAPPTAPVASLAPAPVPDPVGDVAGGAEHPVVSGEVLPPGRDPEAVAVVSGARTLTYRDLDVRVRRVATALTAAGVLAGQPVAVLLPRGPDVVVALLACARVGAVYCPMSVADPADRLHLLLDRLRPALALTDAATAGRLPAVPAPLAVLDGDRWPAAGPAATLDDVAYVIHTSGSTGVPKPVAVGRAALSHLVDAIVGRYALTADDRVLTFTQPHFDVALEEILPTLAVGARLVVPQSEVLGGPELVAVSAARRVTVANLPTSYVRTVAPDLASAWRDGRWRPRLLVVGGEAVTGESLRDLVSTGTTTVLNAYGVTEATVTSTVHEVTGDDLASTATVPLGTDLPGTRTYVVDRSGRPLPDGAVGEIAVAGVGLARGYLHDEAATAGAFRHVDALGGQRVYRTGDRGYRDTAGRLHFAGRLDDQVKFRGYRIEPGEIRSVLVEHPGVRDAYVLLTTGPDGQAQLVAYVEPGPDGDAPEHGQLRAFLAGRLPEHLVPSAFVPVPKLPRTPVGKVRRDDLPPVVATVTRQDVPLASDREERIARIWREVLGVDRVGRTDNFFDLGGHSLLLLRVHARLVRELRADLPVVTLFRYPTVEAIATHLAGEGGESSGRPDPGPARSAGRDRLSRARARRGGTDAGPHEVVPLDENGRSREP